MKRWKANIVEPSENAKKLKKHEDSVVICPQIGQRVVFIDDEVSKDIFKEKIIKLRTAFYFDTGTELIHITKENHKDYDYKQFLKEKPQKYKDLENEINN